jgi:YegS/Rv2252/BmrU family lipid kinase
MDEGAGVGGGPHSCGRAVEASAADGKAEKLLVFANQYAGTLSRLKGEKSLGQYARDAGLEAEVVFTRSGAHLRHLLRAEVVGKRRKVAVAGGDGTVHSAVQELAGTDVVLGILPQGTANNFATALRLPRDLPSAFRVIADGEERTVDMGVANGEYFTEGAGVGIFAEILALAGGSHNFVGVLRALEVILSTMIANRPYRLTLDIDGERHREDALNVTVANSFCVGYNLPIAPHARVTDGELDVVIVEALTRREMFPYFRAIRAQTHLDLPKVQVVKAREVKISTRRPISVHVDERVHKKTPVEVRIVPGSLKVMVDRL